MALRVTQQSVDVLSDVAAGKLRVTQFYVEVLGTQGDTEIVSQSLGITDLASADVVAGGIDLTASSTLAFTDSASEAGSQFSRTISDTMSLTDEAIGINNIPASASSVLAFTDAANFVYEVSASNVMTLTDLAEQNIHELSVSSVIAFTDEALSDIKTLALTDTLALVSSARELSNQFAVSTLLLTDTASQRIKEVSASSTLAFTSTGAAFKVHTIDDSLSLSDTVVDHSVLHRSASNQLGLGHTVSIFFESQGVLCHYSPFVGTGPFVIDPTSPVLTPGTLTLFWPVVSPSVTVVLRNADFGNRISYNANRIYRRTRGGTKICFRKETWPKFVLLSFDIGVLNPTQTDMFKSFLGTTLGLEVGVTDHDGISWKGVITTPGTEITNTGDHGCRQYATSFQFEGALLT